MSTVGQREIATQQRLLGLFKQLGYRYLGHWKARGGSNLEAALLEDWLRKQGYADKPVGKVKKRWGTRRMGGFAWQYRCA